MTRTRLDHGSITLELAVLAPAILLLLGLVLLAGRLATTHQQLDHAAEAAARAATLARDATTARTQATASANANLTGRDAPCTNLHVTVDTTGFTVPAGRPADVVVHLTCTVSLTALGIPGIPGSRTLSATATSPLDTYRTRT